MAIPRAPLRRTPPIAIGGFQQTSYISLGSSSAISLQS
jgi:hypothetical protein